MKKNLVERVRALRLAEGLTESEFTHEVGVNYATYVKFEQGVIGEFPTNDLLKIANHWRFEKYSLWLLTGRTAPSAGQVAPVGDATNTWMHEGGTERAPVQEGAGSGKTV